MEPNYRRCISCRKLAPKAEFFRVVRDHTSQQVQLDRGMGRSAYLCPQADCLAIAKRQKLSRALKTTVPNQLYEELKQRLSGASGEPGRSNQTAKSSLKSLA